MTSSRELNPIFSIITFSIAKDSGLYDIDLSKSENFFWAKDEGCFALELSCVNTDVNTFCSTSNLIGCSENHQYRTLCNASEFNSNCPINLNIQNCKEVFNDTTEQISDSFSPAFTYGKNSVCLIAEVCFLRF